MVVNKDVLLENFNPAVAPPGPASPGRLLVFGINRGGIPTGQPVVTELGGVVPFSFNLVESNEETFLYTTDVIASGSSVFKLEDNNELTLIQATVSQRRRWQWHPSRPLLERQQWRVLLYFQHYWQQYRELPY